MNEFATVLNCMDGRVQRQVADYLATSFRARHIDTITTAGTVRHLAIDTEQTSTLLFNLRVSVDKHGSSHIAVAAHHDCAGNPVPDETQQGQVIQAVSRLGALYPDAEIVGLWVDNEWLVKRL